MACLRATTLIAAALLSSSCGEPQPADPCERAINRMDLARETSRSQSIAITPVRGPGELILTWQGPDGPVACEPAPASECAPAADTCALPKLDAVVGDTATTDLFVVNISAGDLSLYVVDFAYDACADLAVERFEPVVLPPDGVVSVDVVFAPTTPGPCEGWLEVYTNGTNIDRGYPTLVRVTAEGRAPGA